MTIQVRKPRWPGQGKPRDKVSSGQCSLYLVRVLDLPNPLSPVCLWSFILALKNIFDPTCVLDPSESDPRCPSLSLCSCTFRSSETSPPIVVVSTYKLWINRSDLPLGSATRKSNPPKTLGTTARQFLSIGRGSDLQLRSSPPPQTAKSFARLNSHI